MAATTIHNMFEFDGEFKTRLDFAKLAGEKVSALLALEVLLLDEVSLETGTMACTVGEYCVAATVTTFHDVS